MVIFRIYYAGNLAPDYGAPANNPAGVLCRIAPQQIGAGGGGGVPTGDRLSDRTAGGRHPQKRRFARHSAQRVTAPPAGAGEGTKAQWVHVTHKRGVDCADRNGGGCP